MKQLNFAIAMLVAVAIVLCSNIVIGQHAPKNILSVSTDKLVIVPDATIKFSTLPDFINNARRAQGLTVISAEEIRKFLPTNIYRAVNDQYVYANDYDQQNKDPLVGAWRTLVIDRSYLVGDAPPMDILWYWMFSNIENVETRVSDVDQINYLPAWVPQEVKNEFIKNINQGGQIYEKIYVPQGAMFNCAGFIFNCKYTMIDKKLVFLAVDAKTGKRINQLPFWQMTVRYWNYDYTVGFFRDKVNDVLVGCNNLGLYITKNNAPTKTATLVTNQGNNNGGIDKGLGTGGVFLGSGNGQHNLHQPPPNLPTHPCDTVNVIIDGRLVSREVRCDGKVVNIIVINNNNNNCCPPSGGAVQPLVVVPPNPIPPQRKDTLVVILITPNPVSIISNGTTTNQPCDCSGPLVDGFIYTQASVYYDTAYTRNADVELGLNIYPTRSWWGVGLRSGLFGVTENRGEALSGWILAGASGRFYPWSESMVKLTAGLFGANNDLKWRLYRFDNMPWRPVPVAPPYKGLIPMGFNVKQGAGVNMEFYETSLGLGFEARHLKGFSGINYEESYLDLRFNLNDQGSSLRTYWWNQHKGQYNISVPNDFGGTTNYYIAPTISEEWGVRFAFRLKADNQPSRAVAGVMGRLGLTSATSGRYNPLDGNAITGYVALMSQYLGTVDFFGWRRGIGLGFIVNNWPGSRCFVEARYMFFPGTVLGSEIMQNFQRVPVFFQDRNTGLWNVRWEDQYSGVNTHGIMLAFSYFF